MDGTALKTDRILKIYSQLVNGDILRKRTGAAISCHGAEYPT